MYNIGSQEEAMSNVRGLKMEAAGSFETLVRMYQTT
jgi:hypothetical protein